MRVNESGYLPLAGLDTDDGEVAGWASAVATQSVDESRTGVRDRGSVGAQVVVPVRERDHRRCCIKLVSRLSPLETSD